MNESSCLTEIKENGYLVNKFLQTMLHWWLTQLNISVLSNSVRKGVLEMVVDSDRGNKSRLWWLEEKGLYTSWKLSEMRRAWNA